MLYSKFFFYQPVNRIKVVQSKLPHKSFAFVIIINSDCTVMSSHFNSLLAKNHGTIQHVFQILSCESSLKILALKTRARVL